jgi:hypothetical protein
LAPYSVDCCERLLEAVAVVVVVVVVVVGEVCDVSCVTDTEAIPKALKRTTVNGRE